MRTLFLQRFGPVNNSEGQLIKIMPVTVFIGEQGTGKSTIAKLISEFTWLEKALDRGDFLKTEVVKYNRFRKVYCAYQGIHNYFRDDTRIRFDGDKYVFRYEEGHLTITEKKQGVYFRPQVMYFPAERNLISAIENAEKIRRLPGALATLLDEYNRALRASKDGSFHLPLSPFTLQYDKLNKVAWLSGRGAKIRIQEAASGLQSMIPLSIISHYLGDLVRDNSSKELTTGSAEERLRMERTIRVILRDKTLDESVRAVLLKELSLSTRNSRFINVVEEPEQNLFPISQKDVLFDLLRIRNQIPQNELIFTTHSPYLINYLSLAIKAATIQVESNPENAEVLEHIVPSYARVSGDDVMIYVTSSDGSVRELDKYDGMPSDQNALNVMLDDCNRQFEKLLDLDELQNGM